jgi:hypothetical protein
MDLVDLEEYKEYKSITETVTDNKRTALITYVTKLVQTYCNRVFLDYASSPGITEYHSALTTRVYTNHFPIIAVTSVEVSEDAGNTYTALTEGYQDDRTGYIVDTENGIIMQQNQRTPFLYSCELEHNIFKVSYTAGYSELPLDLKLAVFDLVHYYEHDEASVRKTMLGGTLENPMPFNEVDFPPHIKRILSLYRVSYAEEFSHQRHGWPRV